jgi:hypothetical protein
MDVERHQNGTWRVRMTSVRDAPYALGVVHALAAPEAATRLTRVGQGRWSEPERSGLLSRAAPAPPEASYSDTSIQAWLQQSGAHTDLPDDVQVWVDGYRDGLRRRTDRLWRRWGPPTPEAVAFAWAGYRWVATGALAWVATEILAGRDPACPPMSLGGWARADERGLTASVHDLPDLGVRHLPVALRAPDGRVDGLSVVGTPVLMAARTSRHAWALVPQATPSLRPPVPLELALATLLARDDSADAIEARLDVLASAGLPGLWLSHGSHPPQPQALTVCGGEPTWAPGRARLGRVLRCPDPPVDEEASATLAAIFEALAGDANFEALATLATRQSQEPDPRFVSAWAALRERLAQARWRHTGQGATSGLAALSTAQIAAIPLDPAALRAATARDAWRRFEGDPPRVEDPVAPGGPLGSLSFKLEDRRVNSEPSARINVGRHQLAP